MAADRTPGDGVKILLQELEKRPDRQRYILRPRGGTLHVLAKEAAFSEEQPIDWVKDTLFNRLYWNDQLKFFHYDFEAPNEQECLVTVRVKKLRIYDNRPASGALQKRLRRERVSGTLHYETVITTRETITGANPYRVLLTAVLQNGKLYKVFGVRSDGRVLEHKYGNKDVRRAIPQEIHQAVKKT